MLHETEKLVLVVDNDPELRDTIAAALEDHGFRVVTAANGLQALLAIAREEPEVVLLDMRMPMLDGIGFAERLRAFGRHPGIIVMSGAEVSRDELDAIGAVAFVSKPFDLDALARSLGGRIDRAERPAA